MKRALGYLVPALAVLATVSCMTLYDAGALRSLGDVAVVSIQADRYIDVGEVDDLAGAVRTWVASEELDFVPVASRIRDDLFSRYRTLLPFPLVAEPALVGSEVYTGLASSGIEVLSAKEAAVPPGYLAVSPDRKKDREALVSRFSDADGFLWAEVAFTLLKQREFKGTVFVRMRAALTVTVFDRDARAILRHMEFADDATELRIVLVGAVKPSDLAAAALRTTGRASAKMASWLEERGAR